MSVLGVWQGEVEVNEEDLSNLEVSVNSSSVSGNPGIFPKPWKVMETLENPRGITVKDKVFLLTQYADNAIFIEGITSTEIVIE